MLLYCFIYKLVLDLNGLLALCTILLLHPGLGLTWQGSRSWQNYPNRYPWIGDWQLCDLNFADDKTQLTDSKKDKQHYFGVEQWGRCLGLQFLCEEDQVHGGGKNISINKEAIKIVKDLLLGKLHLWQKQLWQRNPVKNSQSTVWTRCT